MTKENGSAVNAPDADAAAAAANIDDPRKMPRRRRSRRSRDHPSAPRRRAGGGGDIVIPLTKRRAVSRLDVAPFVACYTLLVVLDNVMSSSSSSRVAMIVDATFVSLLFVQLLTFLKCQWDPAWRARVGYRRYSFAPPPTSSSRAGQKVRDMAGWTHCLVVPPPPFDARRPSSAGSSSGRTARAERPGIVPVEMSRVVVDGGDDAGTKERMTSHVASIRFRGWTYRCCVNDDGATTSTDDDVHSDLPMESIWNMDDDDDDDDGDDDDGGGGEGEKEEEEDDNGEFEDGDASSSTRNWEPRFHRLHFPVDLPLDFYARRWGGHHRRRGDDESGASSTLVAARSVYGDNSTDIPLPPYLSLLRQQLLQPMFLFQAFCVMLWCLDEYWMYAIYTLLSLLLFECVQAYSRYKSVRRLREDAIGGGGVDGDEDEDDDGADAVECYRMGTWTTVPARRLVVGDVVSLVSPAAHNNDYAGGGGRRRSSPPSSHRRRHRRNDHHERGCTVPADLLLLSGRAVVNEAMLTGESVPQVKESIDAEGGGGSGMTTTTTRLDLSDGGGSSSASHSRCVLFGGTVLVDHHSSGEEGEGGGGGRWGSSGGSSSSSGADAVPPPPNRGLVCFVLRTGFDTVQGQLLRTMAYHAEAGGGGNGGGGEGVNAMETLYFLLILLFCALASAANVVEHAWGDVTRNHFKLMLHVVIIITSVIPPELPSELIYLRAYESNTSSQKMNQTYAGYLLFSLQWS